jgi:hypothetical protein
MAPIRDAAYAVANEFLAPGMKEFFTRWGDNVYQEGINLKSEVEARAYADEKKNDIKALKRQATIQHLYKNVDLPGE